MALFLINISGARVKRATKKFSAPKPLDEWTSFVIILQLFFCAILAFKKRKKDCFLNAAMERTMKEGYCKWWLIRTL